ncbi:hypothetical protein KAW18_08135 [candidate division WOR-3 bacterium]|nr:hypothetical protein [candidate division WOR-3 bacterium]
MKIRVSKIKRGEYLRKKGRRGGKYVYGCDVKSGNLAPKLLLLLFPFPAPSWIAPRRALFD